MADQPHGAAVVQRAARVVDHRVARDLGLNPVLVDCLPDRMMDPNSVEAAISARTKVIIPTQLNGRTVDMGALQKIADDHDLLIIEDAAQALGSKFGGKCAGTFGLAGSISLYPAKLLGCLGDGGILFTDDEEMYTKLYEMRDHGRNEYGAVVRWGVNSRLDNLQAAVLNVKLQYYPEEIKRRRQIARIYNERLKDIEHIDLPPGPNEDGLHYDVFQNYEVGSKHRNELRSYLKEKAIGTIIQWAGKPLHHFKDLGLSRYDLPATDQLFERCFLLPMNTSLSDDDVHYICDAVNRFQPRSRLQ